MLSMAHKWLWSSSEEHSHEGRTRATSDIFVFRTNLVEQMSAVDSNSLRPVSRVQLAGWMGVSELFVFAPSAPHAETLNPQPALVIDST